MRAVRFARDAALLALVLVTLASAGCLRRRFNLCTEEPPHPDCPHDAGMATDASSSDAPADDAAADDAAVTADAAGSPDAP